MQLRARELHIRLLQNQTAKNKFKEHHYYLVNSKWSKDYNDNFSSTGLFCFIVFWLLLLCFVLLTFCSIEKPQVSLQRTKWTPQEYSGHMVKNGALNVIWITPNITNLSNFPFIPMWHRLNVGYKYEPITPTPGLPIILKIKPKHFAYSILWNILSKQNTIWIFFPLANWITPWKSMTFNGSSYQNNSFTIQLPNSSPLIHS